MQGADNGLDRRTLLQLTGVTAASAGLGSLAGCIGGDDDDDEMPDEIVITQGEFPDTVDPNDHITGPHFNIYDHVYEPLFDVDPGESIEGRVVEDWEHVGEEDDEGGAAELTIRDDVVFHDGQELTAEDVAFTINRVIDPEEGPATPQVAGMESITDAEAESDTVVRIEYSGAPALAEYEFGNYTRAMNQEWTEQQDTAGEEDADEEEFNPGAIVGDSADIFNGTGPYQVTEYDPGVEIVLEPFDDYWGDEPTFEQITFNADTESSGRVNALEAGETNLIDNVNPEDASDVREDDDLDIREVTKWRNIFLVMKNGVEPFDSEEFRQAMNYAVDSDEIIDSALNGFGSPMSQPTPPEVNGHNPDLDPYERDLEEAEQLVEDSGHSGIEIELTIPEGRYLNAEEVGEIAADQIDDLDNVDCDFTTTEFANVSDANDEGPDYEEIPFYLIGWGVITGDADYGMAGFFMEDGGVWSFRDDELHEELEASQVEEDPDEREQMLMDINEMAREKAPWVFLYQEPGIYGVDARIDWEPREDESIFTWEME